MQLEKVCKRLLIKEPFWGLFMLGLNKSYSNAVPTLGVRKCGIGVELLVNEGYWNTLSDTEQMAILLHELHHISFGHLLMGSDFSDQQRFNIAADAEVNCYIEGLPPNDGHVDVNKLGLPPRKGAKWYYNNMPQFQSPQSQQGSDSSGSGNQNSGSVPMPNLSDDHSKWKEFDRMSDTQKELVKAQLDTQLKQAAEQTIKSRGTIPACLSEIIKELFKDRPRIYDWRSHFRRVLGTEIETKFRKTYQRESKRFTGAPGIKLKRRIKILVAVDTSGSVSNNELADFFSEINHIYRAGAHVDVLECDAALAPIWEFTGSHDIKITGRGGTDFAPAVDYYRTHKKEYTMFVYFTDGYAPIEHLNVPNNDMLWVITSNGQRQDYPGKVIYIPESPEAKDE